MLVAPETNAGMDGEDDGFSFQAANQNRETIEPTQPATALPSPSRVDGGGGRRISWDMPLASSSPLGSPRTGAGNGVGSTRTPGSNGVSSAAEENGSGYNRRTPKSAPALGWSDGFVSLPEVQMQVLVEVGKLVRAAAKMGNGGNPCKEHLKQCCHRLSA